MYVSISNDKVTCQEEGYIYAGAGVKSHREMKNAFSLCQLIFYVLFNNKYQKLKNEINNDDNKKT